MQSNIYPRVIYFLSLLRQVEIEFSIHRDKSWRDRIITDWDIVDSQRRNKLYCQNRNFGINRRVSASDSKAACSAGFESMLGIEPFLVGS